MFATTAARVHRREGAIQPIAVLSQRLPRYLRLASRIGTLLHRQDTPVYRWTADVVFRDDMARRRYRYEVSPPQHSARSPTPCI
jgi:hypothetical protein